MNSIFGKVLWNYQFIDIQLHIKQKISMTQKIRIIAIATLLKGNPQGVTLNRIFFHMLTRGLIIIHLVIYKDIEEMKKRGLNIRYEGNKIILTSKTLPDFWDSDSPIV